MSKIQVVIEAHEATNFAVHPISGRSGKTYGHATYDPKRGAMCLRMSLEEWREAKHDLCTSRHRFYPLIFDVEVIEDEATADEPTEDKPKRKAAK
jgi:hypothetical protein